MREIFALIRGQEKYSSSHSTADPRGGDDHCRVVPRTGLIYSTAGALSSPSHAEPTPQEREKVPTNAHNTPCIPLGVTQHHQKHPKLEVRGKSGGNRAALRDAEYHRRSLLVNGTVSDRRWPHGRPIPSDNGQRKGWMEMSEGDRQHYRT